MTGILVAVMAAPGRRLGCGVESPVLPIAVRQECVHAGMECPRPCREADDVSMDDCCEPRAAGKWKI